MADVLITPEAQRQFGRLPRVIQGRVLKIFVRLKNWPDVSGAKPLSGGLAGHYRIRTGDYRVQFRVAETDDTVRVLVEKIGHRDGFYGD